MKLHDEHEMKCFPMLGSRAEIEDYVTLMVTCHFNTYRDSRDFVSTLLGWWKVLSVDGHLPFQYSVVHILLILMDFLDEICF